MKTLAILGLILVSRGAGQAQERVVVKAFPDTEQETHLHRFEATLYALATRSQDEDKDASARLARQLRLCKDSKILYHTAVWAIHRMQSHHCDGSCNICYRYEEIRDESLFALADLHTQEAARRLVDLLTVTGWWDGHAGEEIAFAISKMGKITLPFLERSRDRSGLAMIIIKAVKSGEVLR